MKKATPGMVLLSACMLSSCGQETAKTNAKSPQAKASLSIAEVPGSEYGADVTQLQKELQQVQQKLDASAAALVKAREQIKIKDRRLSVINHEKSLLKNDRNGLKATTRHVKALEEQMGNQDMQLSRLRETLLATEAGCKEVADQLARNMTN